MTPDEPTLISTILCDTHDCTQRLVVHRNLTESQSVVVALEHGWEAHNGASRAYHFCKRHAKGAK
jgi:hypothetical protein